MTSSIPATRNQIIALIGANSAFWSATCQTADANDAHTMAWDWLRGGATEEGVEIDRGSVRVTAPDGTRYRVITEFNDQMTGSISAEISEIEHEGLRSVLSRLYHLARETRFSYSEVRTGVRGTGYTGDGVRVGAPGALLGAALEGRGMWDAYLALLLSAADRTAYSGVRETAVRAAEAMRASRA